MCRNCGKIQSRGHTQPTCERCGAELSEKTKVASEHSRETESSTKKTQQDHSEVLTKPEEDFVLMKESDAEAITLYMKGQDLFESQRYEEALIAFHEAAALRSGWADPLYRQGVILSVLERREEALMMLQAAIDSDYELEACKEEACLVKAGVLQKLGLIDEAVLACDHAIELNQDSVEAWEYKGIVLSLKGQNEEALKAFETVVLLSPGHVNGWQCRSLSLYRLGRIDEAEACFERAADIDSDLHLAGPPWQR